MAMHTYRWLCVRPGRASSRVHWPWAWAGHAHAKPTLYCAEFSRAERFKIGPRPTGRRAYAYFYKLKRTLACFFGKKAAQARPTTSCSCRVVFFRAWDGPDFFNLFFLIWFSGDDNGLVGRILDPSLLNREASVFRNIQQDIRNSGTSAAAWVGEAGGAFNSGRNHVTNAFVMSFW